MTRLVLFFLLLGAATSVEGAAPPLREPSKPDQRTDLEKMQGKWEPIYVSDGKTTETLQPVPSRGFLVIDADTWSIPSWWSWGELTLDSKKKPNEVNLTLHQGTKGYLAPSEVLGIYHLEGNTLTIQTSDRKSGRPAHFANSKKDITGAFMVFKRTKP